METNGFSLFAKKPEELVGLLNLDKRFQGKQIYDWLVKGETSFDQMTNLPKALRERLAVDFPSAFSSTVIATQTDDEGNSKLALGLYDKSIIECVLLKDKEGELTACVSSQVGCAMGCKFCRTGTLKLTRNLHDYEIVEQFAHLKALALQLYGTDITHVVFMGMGEPLANLDNVLSAISFLHDPNGYNLSHRRITISTCGLVPGIVELTCRAIPVKLAVSLVTADDPKRSSLMPVNKAYGLVQLRNALVAFQKESGRRFTFEYCMIHNVNVSDVDADNLQHFCRGLEVIVNLIPFNPCSELDFETPTEKEIKAFTAALTRRGVSYTIRISRGRSIKGACGQLAGKLN